MRGRVWLAALSVMGVLVAGCTDGGKDPTTVPLSDGSTVKFAEPDNTPTKGSISGVVVDEAIRPLAGVNVSLLGSQMTTMTDADGLFIFEGLDPGLFTLSVLPLRDSAGHRFLGIQTTAEVVAGETARVRLVLPPDPTPQPYHATYKFDAYDQATVGLVDGPYEIIRQGFLNDTAAPPLCDACTFYVHPEGPVATFLMEAVWEDSIADPAGPTTFFFALDALEGEGRYSDYCASPCHVEIEGSGYEEAATVSISMYPDENWVAFQQRWQVFLTLWYLDPPPEGWSFVNGDV